MTTEITLTQYIQSLNSRLEQGHTSEHIFRGDLERLLRTFLPEHNVTNEPSNITDCDNPNYVVSKDKIPVGYIEVTSSLCWINLT